MCGICGIFRKDNPSDVVTQIQTMNQSLRHRGPDDEGYVIINQDHIKVLAGKDTPAEVLSSGLSYCPVDFIDSYSGNGVLALGHRRLSIIDISAKGHQPMCSDNQQVWIVFNGEIYNYIELREELKLNGYSFKSNSDTEVIINAWHHWGRKCVDHFNGMWAFVIYDQKENILFGSRDRLGVKPLYFNRNQGQFIFASEQKALVQCKFVDTSLNEKAVFDYLVLSHGQSEPEGFFKGIVELGAGHCFVLSLSSLKFETYSFFSTIEIKENAIIRSVKEEADELLQLMNRAVVLRTRSDVPVGACLSGGIDSSFIVMILSEYLKQQQNKYVPKVFTVAFPGYDFNEESWARKVVENSSVEWHITNPTGEEWLEDLQSMLYAADSPMLSTSTYAQYRVMKLASENGIKVLLDGQGADELFAGYSHFDNTYYNELATSFKFITLFREMSLQGGVSKSMKNWMHANVRYLMQNLPSGLSKLAYEQSIPDLKYIRPELKNQFKERFGQLNFPFGTNLNTVLKQCTGGEDLQMMFRLEDRMSMNFSVESRLPFSDDLPLIQYALSLPSSFKIKDGIRKSILRQAGKGVLPDAIAARKDKIGFQAPEQAWLRSLKDHIPELLESNISEYVNVDLLKRDFGQMIPTGNEVVGTRLLRCIFFSQWRKIYNI